MDNCGHCDKLIEEEEKKFILTCKGACQKQYHIKCLDIQDDKFIRMRAKKLTWICPNCKEIGKNTKVEGEFANSSLVPSKAIPKDEDLRECGFCNEEVEEEDKLICRGKCGKAYHVPCVDINKVGKGGNAGSQRLEWRCPKCHHDNCEDNYKSEGEEQEGCEPPAKKAKAVNGSSSKLSQNCRKCFGIIEEIKGCIKCTGHCSSYYHAPCVNKTVETVKKMSLKVRESWQCPDCSAPASNSVIVKAESSKRKPVRSSEEPVKAAAQNENCYDCNEGPTDPMLICSIKSCRKSFHIACLSIGLKAYKKMVKKSWRCRNCKSKALKPVVKQEKKEVLLKRKLPARSVSKVESYEEKALAEVVYQDTGASGETRSSRGENQKIPFKKSLSSTITSTIKRESSRLMTAIVGLQSDVQKLSDQVAALSGKKALYNPI